MASSVTSRPSSIAATGGARRRWFGIGLALVVVLAAVALWPRGQRGSGRSAAKPSASRGNPFAPRATFGPNGWQIGPRKALGPIALHPVGDGLVRVTGTVIDLGNHKAVGDVEVVFADGNTEASAVADVAGRYSIDLPAGRYRPFVRADGVMSASPPLRERLPARPRPEQVAAVRVEQAFSIELRRNTDGVDLEVVRSGKVHGRVVDRSGNPITGAIVRAFPTDEAGTPRPILGTDIAETGSDGFFDLEVASSTYRLDAYHDRFGGVSSVAVVDVQPAQTAETELTMTAGCVITGRVVRLDGQPLGSGALERSYGGGGDGVDSFYPDGDFGEDGTFQWTTTEEMEVQLRAWPWKSTHSQARRFSCRDGVRYDDVVFEIPRADADLQGRVVRADGTPIPFAFVDIGGLSEGAMNQQERADADGNWAVYALPAGQYRVTATADGVGAVSVNVSAPAADVELRMSGTGTLAGKVAGMTDGTFALAVYACTPSADGERVAVEMRRVVSVTGGTYEVTGVPACATVDLAISHGTHHLMLEASVPVDGTGTLDLDLADPVPVTVRGVVRNPDGRGAPHAMVSAIGESYDGSFVEADENGRFTIQAFGGDQLVARGPEGGFGRAWIEKGGPATLDLDVELEPDDLPLEHGGDDEPVILDEE